MKATPSPSVQVPTTPVPNTTTPLMDNNPTKEDLQRAPNGSSENGVKKALTKGNLLNLIGNWNSPADQSTPIGYNVMPLPQNADAVDDFILKNNTYYEQMTFAPIEGNVANRGGNYQQNSNVLFYEQRVFFAASPQAPVPVPNDTINTLVHAENGSWLFLDMSTQREGAYSDGPVVKKGPPKPPQNPNINIVKQVSVPHGNSILAPGAGTVSSGPPTIHDVSALPHGTGVDSTYYTIFGSTGPNDPTNHTNLNVNTNYVLQDYITRVNTGNKAITNTVHFSVDSQKQDGGVTNIIFEYKNARVIRYRMDMWLETLADGTYQLQYSQIIDLMFRNTGVVFPHITANTMTLMPASS